MRKSFGKKSWLFPLPVLIIGTYNEDGSANAMNAAWGGIYDTNKVGICLASHRTTDNIFREKVFTVSFATVEQIKACDYVGMVSGNSIKDKVERAGWTYSCSEMIHAPLFDQLPVALICQMISYNEESGYMVADILDVSVDESVITDGKIDMDKFHPVALDDASHKYVAVKESVFDAFSVKEM